MARRDRHRTAAGRDDAAAGACFGSGAMVLAAVCTEAPDLRRLRRLLDSNRIDLSRAGL